MTAVRPRAICRDDPDLYFPAGYSHSYRPQIDAAKRTCARCPLLSDCLREALADEGSKDGGARNGNGIRGGLTPGERYRLYLKVSGGVPAAA